MLRSHGGGWSRLTFAVRRPRRRVRRLTAVGSIAAVALSGCADHEEQSLCNAYSEYVVLADEAYAADPTAATAADAADAIEVLLGEVAQLRSVADGRYRAPIDALDALLADLDDTLDSLPDDADYSTWQPLVDETLDDVQIADDRLRRVINPVCAARFADGDGSSSENDGSTDE